MTPGDLCLPLVKLPRYRLLIQTVRRKTALREAPMLIRRRGRRRVIVLPQDRARKRRNGPWNGILRNAIRRSGLLRSALLRKDRRTSPRKGLREGLRKGPRKGFRKGFRRDHLRGRIQDHPLNLTRTAPEQRTRTRRSGKDRPVRAEKTASRGTAAAMRTSGPGARRRRPEPCGRSGILRISVRLARSRPMPLGKHREKQRGAGRLTALGIGLRIGLRTRPGIGLKRFCSSRPCPV